MTNPEEGDPFETLIAIAEYLGITEASEKAQLGFDPHANASIMFIRRIEELKDSEYRRGREWTPSND